MTSKRTRLPRREKPVPEAQFQEMLRKVRSGETKLADIEVAPPRRVFIHEKMIDGHAHASSCETAITVRREGLVVEEGPIYLHIQFDHTPGRTTRIPKAVVFDVQPLDRDALLDRLHDLISQLSDGQVQHLIDVAEGIVAPA